MNAPADPESWVEGADASDWPLRVLPYGVGGHAGEASVPVTRIGEYALRLADLVDAGLLSLPREAVGRSSLNPLMALGRDAWSELRTRLTRLLSADAGHRQVLERMLLPARELTMVLPIEVADYVDFYSSREHATNLGRLFRPDGEPLLPNWHHLPVGYHGRAGTIVVSGTPIMRPCGQRRALDGGPPTFGPSRRLDFELEVGFVIGAPSAREQPVPTSRADRHIFGVVMLNDWSARDIQSWEYQPLGPFLGKSFATSISPWVVPLAALDAVRVSGPTQEPAVLEYLRVGEPWGFDIDLAVALRTAMATATASDYATICRTNLAGLYWNPAQHVAHTTINGACLRTGDVHASGTVSGSEPGSFGSMIELTAGGQQPLAIGGESRAFLEDGDSVILRGTARPAGGRPFTLGEVEGTIVAADRDISVA